ncbi:ATP-binding cassette domain-containing protein [Candidatus Albibeggiatoa sp. nov. BB20]|uniref:ABC transporter ATP-binding protein n=1 Tax=Candidatus Albibeggiatoa sp. nov. BB20 TaxID=3162723 RepID=UPI0033654058
MDNIIEIRDLYTSFADLSIHEKLNLEIKQGEILALIGGSGAGKSTLLREMILLEQPTSGSIQILGHDILNLKDSLWLRRHCGVMFQNGALFGSLTVAENIALPLQEHTELSDNLIAEIVALKIALVQLPQTAGQLYPSQLSGGMVKRAALARALALDPQIIFLDEPTAGLDPIGAAALDQLIVNLKQLLGLTIVMVTHDLDSLRQVADRIAVLADKQVITVQTFDVLLEFEHDWVQTYFHGIRGKRFSSIA